MKKTLIALAALAATGATLAQSSVTIYGRMDLGMSSIETTNTRNGGVTGGSESFSLAGAQNQFTGSRLGFRGTEDLGGGLRAGFVYEIGINADRQTTTIADTDGNIALGNAQTRLANLSLTGGFGTVVVGTFMNAFDTVRGFTTDVANTPGGDFLEGHGGLGGRSENAIAYVSPAFSGFTFSVGTVNEESTEGVGAARAGSEFQGVILGLGYAQGPLRAQFAFVDADGTDVNANAPDQNADVRNWALGLTYTLPQVVLSFVYEDGRATGTTVGVAGSNVGEFSAWQIGARFPMGAFTPFVSFGDGEIEGRSNGVLVDNADTRSWQIGTTYNLSTRTWVYAAVGEFRASGNIGGAWRDKTDGYSIGLVHTF